MLRCSSFAVFFGKGIFGVVVCAWKDTGEFFFTCWVSLGFFGVGWVWFVGLGCFLGWFSKTLLRHGVSLGVFGFCVLG